MEIRIRITRNVIRLTMISQFGKDVLEYLPQKADRKGFSVNVSGEAFWFPSEKAAMGFLNVVINRFLQSHNL